MFLAKATLRSRTLFQTFGSLPISSSISRNLFNDTYLGIDDFIKRRNSVRLRINNESGFRTRIKTSFEESGLRNIFSEDLEGFIDIAESPEDLSLLSTMIRSSLQEGNRPLNALPKLTSWYFALCKLMGEVEAAKEVWLDPEMQKSGILDKNKTIRGRYFTLLYENGRYNDIVEEVESNLGQCTIDDVTLAIASLYHLNTEESYKKATEFMKKEPMKKDHTASKASSGTRGTYICAYFAFKRGECGTAYDILTDSCLIGRPNRLSSNLKLTILTEVNRIEDALLLIRTEFIPPPDTRRDYIKKRHICFEVMQNLAKKVKSLHEPTSEIGKEFTSLCRALDDTAILCDETFEQILFEKIGTPPGKAKDSEFPRRSRKRRGPRDEEGDELL